MEALIIAALAAAGLFAYTHKQTQSAIDDEMIAGATLPPSGDLITAFTLDVIAQVTDSITRDRIVGRPAYIGQHLASPILSGLDYDSVMFGVYTMPNEEEAAALSLAVGFGAAITVTDAAFLEGISLRPGSVIVGSVGSWATMRPVGIKAIIVTRRAVRHGVLGNVVGVSHDYEIVDAEWIEEKLASDGRWIVIYVGTED